MEKVGKVEAAGQPLLNLPSMFDDDDLELSLVDDVDDKKAEESVRLKVVEEEEVIEIDDDDMSSKVPLRPWNFRRWWRKEAHRVKVVAEQLLAVGLALLRVAGGLTQVDAQGMARRLFARRSRVSRRRWWMMSRDAPSASVLFAK